MLGLMREREIGGQVVGDDVVTERRKAVLVENGVVGTSVFVVAERLDLVFGDHFFEDSIHFINLRRVRMGLVLRQGIWEGAFMGRL